MSNYPNSLDDDSTLPIINNNITEIGDEAVNALRDAVFNIETTLGLNPQGTNVDLATRLAVIIDPVGNLKPSALTGLGLVVLPITNDQVSATAAIDETKLNLDHGTSDLYNLIIDQNVGLTTSLNFINFTGSKINPHINGTSFNHILNHINVSTSPSEYFKNQFNLNRDNTNSYTVLNDLNDDFINHQKKDGTGAGTDFTTVGGLTLKSNFAHPASGIFVNPSNFTFIPQTVNDVQSLADFINNTNILLLGSRAQTLFSNGISRTARSTTFDSLDSLGQLIVPYTNGISYLLYNDSSAPVDNISTGDDVLEFTPETALLLNNSFDNYFASIKVGDIATINYGDAIITSTVKEFRAVADSLGNKKFIIRVNSKNIRDSIVSIKVNRPQFNTNKYGVLATGIANNSFNEIPSLIVGNPRAAQALGNNFNPDSLDPYHYNLYLQLYPYGDPAKQATIVAAIDITGNQGTTPGKYTLSSTVQSANDEFRKNGFNSRFMAFENKGQFGIMLTDVYNNAAFSIIAGVVDGYGFYDQAGTQASYPKNVIGLFDNKDSLGFGPSNSGVASPPYSTNFSSYLQARNPTKIYVPLTKNNYYVNGAEKDKLNFVSEIDNNILPIDGYGASYFPAIVSNKQVFPSSRVELTYKIDLNLSVLDIKAGKTIVVQPSVAYNLAYVNFGRFTIKDIAFDNCNCDGYSATTYITVYDSVANIGISPYANNAIGTAVNIYITDDSVSFNSQNANDNLILSNFKRSFEVYVDANGHTFTHERARLNSSGTSTTIAINPSVVLYSSPEISFINIADVSPKLKGYDFSGFNKLTLHINNYNASTGYFDGYLCKFNGVNITNIGKLVIGKKGEVVRFYDETNIDFIDIIFNIDDIINTFANQNIDIQLYPSLQQNYEYLFLSTVQLDNNNYLNYLIDKREFGNVNEDNLTNSALNYISAGDKYLHENGVLSGFDIVGTNISEKITFTGGTALVNGRIINVNNSVVSIPVVRELYSSVEYQKVLWVVCINVKGEFEVLPINNIDTALPSSAPVENRVITLLDPVSQNTYSVKSRTIEDLIKSRKEYIPLYQVTSITLGSFPSTITTALAIKDIRKFDNHRDDDISLTITSPTLNRTASFYSITSLNNYIGFNPNNDYEVKVKGSITVDASISNELNINNGGNGTLNVNSNITFSNVKLNDLTINITGSLTFGSNVIVNNCIFNISSRKGLILNGTKIKLNKNTFNYLYDATSDADFLSSNLVNHKAAAIFNTNNTATLSELEINDNKFNSTIINRFPFISFISENTFTTTPSNVNITNNIFNGTSLRADIAFICENSSDELVLNSININNNTSNNGIFIISALNASSPYTTLGYVCKNVKITENVVPTIGFLTKSSLSVVSDNIYIAKNVSTYITNLNYNGQYIPFTFSSTDSVTATNNTGAYVVDSNTVSWIHLGSRAYTYVINNKIVNNNLCLASAATYLSNFTNTDYTITPDNEAIVVHRGDTLIDFANTLIDSNSIFAKDSNKYLGGITVLTNSSITNNIVNKCVAGGAADMLYLGYITKAVVSHNQFIRGTDSIFAYVEGVGTGYLTASNVIISENIFDLSTVDGTDENVGKEIPVNWTFERNKNQTAYTLINLESKFDNNYLRYQGNNNYSLYGLDTSGGADSFATANFSSSFYVYRFFNQDFSNITTVTPQNFNLYIKSTSNPRLGIFEFNLNEIIPNNTTFVLAKGGMSFNVGFGGTTSSDSINAYALTTRELINNTDDFIANPNNTWINPNSTYTNSNINVSNIINYPSFITNSTSNASYATVAPINGIQLTSGNSLLLELRVGIQMASGDAVIQIAPIVVKYRW